MIVKNKLKINKIYLDMDGPLVNDLEMYAKVSDIEYSKFLDNLEIGIITGRHQAMIHKCIPTCIEQRMFENASITYFGLSVQDRILKWKNAGIEVNILSSVMNDNPLKDSLYEQKHNWLKRYNFDSLIDNVILVEGARHKQNYADPKSLLIDDYSKNVSRFIENNGNAIHFTDSISTEYKLNVIGL